MRIQNRPMNREYWIAKLRLVVTQDIVEIAGMMQAFPQRSSVNVETKPYIGFLNSDKSPSSDVL